MLINDLENILKLYRSCQKIINEVEDNKHFFDKKMYVFSAREYDEGKIKGAIPLSVSQTNSIYELAKVKKGKIEEIVKNFEMIKE